MGPVIIEVRRDGVMDGADRGHLRGLLVAGCRKELRWNRGRGGAAMQRDRAG